MKRLCYGGPGCPCTKESGCRPSAPIGGGRGPEEYRLRLAFERTLRRAEAAEAKLATIRERASEMGDSTYDDLLEE